MATQTGSYDFKAAKAAHDEASQTASNYITEINNDGIMVHAEGDGPDDTQTPSGWHISDVLEYIRQGVSRFWIGLKNQGDITPTVRIGKESGESRMELDYHSLKMMDKEGNEYLHISDLRGADGTFELTENFAANYADYVIALVPSEVISVMVDDVSVGYTLTIYEDIGYARIRLDNPAYPQSGSIVSVRYKTTSGNAKAYTLGTRKANANIGAMSYAEGKNVESSGYISHAEGMNTVASHRCSHAEGDGTKATSLYCHAEGSETIASDWASHAEGMHTVASGVASHAGGSFTVAAGLDQTAIGRCNVEDSNSTYAVIVGNGSDDSNRSNALTVDWDATTKLWHPSIQRGTVPSSSIYGGGGTLRLVDNDGDQIGYLQPIQLTDGSEGIQVGVSNEDGTDWNNIQLTFNGATPGVSVSRKKEWRDALGALARVPGSSAELPNCTATSNVFPIVLGNTFANNGEISYMSAANFRNMIGAAMHDFYQATGASGTMSTTAGTITPITLVTTGNVSNGSGFSISGGGIKVANAGKYRVTASMYILGTNATFKGVYVKKNNNSTGGTGELMGLHYPYTASGVQVGPKIVSLAANDVLYLCGRMGGVAGTIYTNNTQTYLLVERVV